MELNDKMIFMDRYQMPSIFTCVEKTDSKIVLYRHEKCHCDGDLGIQTDGQGNFWEFCLVCKKEFRN